MPEGHTLHRLAGEFNERFRGRITRSTSPQGRFESEAAQLDGLPLTNAHAYGKHLFCEFGEPGTAASRIVHVHLGLLGKFAFFDGPPPEPVGALRWRLTTAFTPGVSEDEISTSDLRGATVVELVDEFQVDDIITRLGPDPIRPDSDPERAWARIKRSSKPIAALLMDQKIAPGVGNIYRAELLYRHKVDPFMAGKLLKPAEWQAMWDDLVILMREGVLTGRIDTVRPEHTPDAMGREPRVDRHGGEVYVYRRTNQPCLVCGQPVKTIDLEGRNLFWCGRCQRKTRRKG